MRLWHPFFCCILFLIPELVGAQANTGTIVGAIRNEKGESIPGITIMLEGSTRGTASVADGRFQIKNVKPGNHTLLISGIGYARQSRAITLKPNQNLHIDIRLAEDTQQLAEVVVKGASESAKLIESAKAVDVIETKTLKLQSADLGEIIAQTQGVNVRRSGGLGSGTRFAMNGLTDDQVRFFINGIPLHFAGYSLGIANVPVNLIDRVEIYKGVVPIQFGADALGGIVNLVSPKVDPGFHGEVSYQTGSFGTHRLSSNLQLLDEQKGVFLNGNVFHDVAQNDYKINVQVPDVEGRLSEATVRRFHDSYKATGANAQVGYMDKPWAKEASVTFFTTSFSKDIQHNNVMTIPYGEATFHRQSHGGLLRFLSPENNKLQADVLLGYAYEQRHFLDTGRFVYNWFGERIRERGSPGEIGLASNQFLWDHNAYGRINIIKTISNNHKLLFSSAPTMVSRTGDEKRQINPDTRDPLTAQRDLLTLINGLEYLFNSGNDKLENRLFIKDYIQNVRSEEPVSGRDFRRKDRQSHFQGIGNSIRYRLNQEVSLKASYEWTTRLPRAEEIFGNGMLTLANLELEPERSHNANLEITYKSKLQAMNSWKIGINGFLRVADQLIVLLGDQNLFRYQNVFEATSAGVEAAVSWKSQDNRWQINGNATWQDFRNTSENGSFRQFQGDRIPNRPYLFANGAISYRFSDLLKVNDHLNLFWNMRFVDGFFRTWESAGLRQFKQTIPSQFINHAGVTYNLPNEKFRSSITAEAQNLANAEVFDFFGVQRPGRAFFIKVTTQF
ncbi:MAG: carboxypeptidase-like regulatory domain-containing protein [Cyclobacteriaceae bacterium]